MAQSVDTSGLDNLVESWNKLLKTFPKEKAVLLQKMGADMLGRVQQAIGGTGKVQGWQAVHMGSGKGYAAVRPKAKAYQETKSGKKYAVGYITNAIEGGHKHGGPRGSGKSDRRRPSYHVAAVPGKYFYRSVRQQLASMGDDEVRSLAQKIIDGLEGKL